MTRLAGAARYGCPLGCGWSHEDLGIDFADAGAALEADPAPPAPAGCDPVLWSLMLRSKLATEAALREHFESHSLVEWVTAVARLNGELAAAREAQRRIALAVRSSHALAAEVLEGL